MSAANEVFNVLMSVQMPDIMFAALLMLAILAIGAMWAIGRN